MRLYRLCSAGDIEMRTNDLPGIDAPPRLIPAWAFSLVFHVIVLTAIGWSAQRQSLGTNAEVDRPVGIAIQLAVDLVGKSRNDGRLLGARRSS